MASARAIAWVEALTWTLAYGGLIVLVTGLAAARTHAALGWSLVAGGAVVAASGFALVLVRSRMSEPPAGGAQSTPTKTPDTP